MEPAATDVLLESSLFSSTFLRAWILQINRFTELVASLSDEGLARDTAPGRNSGVYLLGHMVAIHDALFPLLGIGQRHYPQFDKLFVQSPDKSGHEFPAVADLRSSWREVNEKLIQELSKMQPHEWLSKHAAVSAEDFQKEPNRNKLNVLITRITHLNYHWGQMTYLKERGI